jgi:hypothetical protein
MDNIQKIINSTIFALVGITTEYGLDGRGSVPGQQAFYPVSAAGTLPRGKATGAWSWPASTHPYVCMSWCLIN